MKVAIRSKSGIPNHLPIKIEDCPFIFFINVKTPDVVATVTISDAGDNIYSVATFDVSDDMYKSLDSNLNYNNISEKVKKEYINISIALHNATRHIFDLIRQELYLYELRWLTSNPDEWLNNNEEWKIIPWQTISTAWRSHSAYKLDKKWVSHLQLLLDRGEEALLAIEHLHEAERAVGPQFQWIEATIAAELAIKEILVRIEPKLEVLLYNLPSPPLDKLYGDVLKSITGESSQFVNIVRDGARIRNYLIHKPKSHRFNYQEVNNYIANIKKAIKYLLDVERKANRKLINGT